MSAQILMCVRSVAIMGLVIATKGKTYTYRDTHGCHCGRKMVQVQEVSHPKLHPCFPGDSWLPSECFVPMNDPKLGEKAEHYDTPAPRKQNRVSPEGDPLPDRKIEKVS